MLEVLDMGTNSGEPRGSELELDNGHGGTSWITEVCLAAHRGSRLYRQLFVF